MTHMLNHQVSGQGKLRRALASVFSFLQAMEATPFDCTLDRLERLEREVGELREEMRRSRELGPVDVREGSAAGLER